MAVDKRRKNCGWDVCDEGGFPLKHASHYDAAMLAVVQDIRDYTALLHGIHKELQQLNALLQKPGLNLWGPDWLRMYAGERTKKMVEE